MICKDQLDREIVLKEVPKRIVSLVPSQTELLVDLGLENSIVGVTKFCIHPKELRKKKTIVGGTKQVNLQKIRALRPDIILCNKEENTKEIIEAMSDIAPIYISDIYNMEDCYELIAMYGELFQVAPEASKIIGNIQKERQQFKPKLEHKNRCEVAYFIWKNPWMVAASNTFIDEMIKEAGFKNVFQNIERYPEINLDSAYLKEAEWIFLSSEPYPFKEVHVDELQKQFPDKQIVVVDGEMFSWYGSRLKKSYRYFESLHS